MPKDINKSEFVVEVLQSELPVLVDFWAPWCGPCKMMTPVLEELSKEFAGKLKICKVNTEEGDNGMLAMEYSVMSIPNMKLFKNGEVIQDFIGFRPLKEFGEELKQIL